MPYKTTCIFKKCIICNKEFKTYIKFIKKGQGKFCSQKCYRKWFKRHIKERKFNYKRIKFSCLFCKKSFFDYPAHISRKYCSKKCYNQNRIGKYLGKNSPSWKGGKTKYFCKLCKKEFLSYKSRNSKYCSTGCEFKDKRGEKSSAWKGGKPKCKICSVEISYASTYCLNHKHLLWDKKHWKAARLGAKKYLTGKMPKNIIGKKGKYGNITRGYFNINDKGIFFRSKWEANYALYLDFLIKQNKILKWEYETDVFIFEKIKFGTRSYRPDFKIYNNDGNIEYHEIKGWMDKKSITKLRRMRIYYPQVKLRIIGEKEYFLLKSQIGKLLNFF